MERQACAPSHKNDFTVIRFARSALVPAPRMGLDVVPVRQRFKFRKDFQSRSGGGTVEAGPS